MTEQIITRDNKVYHYESLSRLYRAFLHHPRHMCKTGQLNYITTSSGLRRIDTQQDNNDNKVLVEKSDLTQKMLMALCKQFNVSVLYCTLELRHDFKKANDHDIIRQGRLPKKTRS